MAGEVPPLVLDPYRLEAILRTTPPGRENVVLLGNSITEMAFDRGALEARFAARRLRFPKLTIGGAPALTFGMLAEDVARLGPTLAVYVASPPALRSRGYEDHVYAYDAGALADLFTPAELLASPRFHVDGAAGQLHVLARHRRAMQRAALVRLGRLSWRELEATAHAVRLRHVLEGADQWQSWVAERSPDTYPNPNTRSLLRLARELRAHGGRLVVMEAPLHPIPLLLARARIEAARAELARLASEADFALVPHEELPALGEEDFGDWVHTNARGRERMTAFLGDYLTRAL